MTNVILYATMNIAKRQSSIVVKIINEFSKEKTCFDFPYIFLQKLVQRLTLLPRVVLQQSNKLQPIAVYHIA